MIRAIIDGLLIFLIPFAAYAGYQVIAQKDPKAAFRMTHGPFIALTIAGLLLCIGTIVVSELLKPPATGGYQRATWENGQFKQGEVK